MRTTPKGWSAPPAPLLLQKAHVEVRVAGHRQGLLPAPVDLPLGSHLEVDPLRLHEPHGPGIQVDDLDPFDLVAAQASEVLRNVLRQIRRLGREQYPVGLLLEHLPGQLPGAVHGDDGLARARPPQDTGRAVELLADQFLLAGVQEDAPLGQRGVQDRGEVVLRLDGHEPPLRVGVLRRRAQVSGYHLLGRGDRDHRSHVLDGVALAQPGQSLGRLSGEVLDQGEECLLGVDGTHRRQQCLRPERQQDAIVVGVEQPRFLGPLLPTTASSASLTLNTCSEPVTGLTSKRRLPAQSIAWSWFHPDQDVHVPLGRMQVDRRYFWSIRTVRTLSSFTAWSFS